MRRTPLHRSAVPLERRTRAKRKPVSPASVAQRMKVLHMECVRCGRDRHEVKLDPGHLTRGMGGCDDPLCVVPLCRLCHDLYDDHGLDLLPYLEPAWRPELAHAVEHLGLIGALRRITNLRWKVDE